MSYTPYSSSMDLYNRIGSIGAHAERVVAKVTGQKIAFTTSGIYPSPVATLLRASYLMQELGDEDAPNGRLVALGKIHIIVPVQKHIIAHGYTGTFDIFPMIDQTTPGTRPFRAGDKIEYPINSSRFWFIRGDIVCIHNSWAYEFYAIEQKTLTIGPKS